MKYLHTEMEIYHSIEKSLFLVGNDLARGRLQLEDVSYATACHIHVNNSQNVAVEYIDDQVPRHFNITPEEVEKDGLAVVQRVCHPEDLTRLQLVLNRLALNEDQHQVASVFMRMQRVDDAPQDYSLHLIAFKIYQGERCLGLTVPVSNFDNIAVKIADLLNERSFLKNNFQKFASLTPREREILTLLAVGRNNPEIADLLSISRRTVENHRKNIRRKLEIKNFVELMQFAQAFDLV